MLILQRLLQATHLRDLPSSMAVSRILTVCKCRVCVSVMRSISYFCCARSASCRLPTSGTSPAVWRSVAFCCLQSAVYVYLLCAIFLIFVVPAAPPAGYPPQGPPQQYGGQSHSCRCAVSCCSVVQYCSFVLSSSTWLPSSVLKNATPLRDPSVFDDVPFVAFEVKTSERQKFTLFSCFIPHFCPCPLPKIRSCPMDSIDSMASSTSSTSGFDGICDPQILPDSRI
jgi:hypothetical protein